jgi:aminoglycoside phosphotransferase (APT) family kinase protein
MEDFRERIEAALRRHCGAVTVASVRPLSGGAASLSWRVEAVRGGKDWPLIVQRAGAEGATLGRRAQAVLLMAASGRGVPVPTVAAVFDTDDGLGDAWAVEALPGEALAPKWLRAVDGPRFTDEVAAALARIHAIELEAVAAAGLATPDPLGVLRDLYRMIGVRNAVFDLAFDWLDGRLPVGRNLVHGDFRSGNFLVGDAGLAAVLDWELAHIGDRHADIGWICVNAWRFGRWQQPVGGFGAREAFYAAYEAAGGAPVDWGLATAYELWGTLRWGVMCLQMAHAHVSGLASSVERAAIGRRVSENEADILHILKCGSV